MNPPATPAALRAHFSQIVLPLWRGPGFNAALRLPYEALDTTGRAPLPVVRYRAMACARQLFVFSQADDAHAHTLFESLCHYFFDRARGGWFYSVDAQGAPLDTTKDLYTHAFVVFACAAYIGRFGGTRAAHAASAANAPCVAVVAGVDNVDRAGNLNRPHRANDAGLADNANRAGHANTDANRAGHTNRAGRANTGANGTSHASADANGAAHASADANSTSHADHAVGDALAVLHQTSALIAERFAAHDGLFNAALDAGFATVTGAPVQNPMMHLTEAWLAAHDATRDAAFAHTLTKLLEAIARAFLHAPTGCIAELPVDAKGTWSAQSANGNRIEPGHQFEWFYLVSRAAEHLDTSGLDTALRRAFRFAAQYGVNPATGSVRAALDAQGKTLDATERIWAQTEYLRALALHPDDAVKATLPQQIAHFTARFIQPHGWYECKNTAGDVTRADMPSTTPYHLLTAYSALPQ